MPASPATTGSFSAFGFMDRKENTNGPLAPKARWLRIPDVEAQFGLKVRIVYELLNSGRVKSAVCKLPGNSRGVRLVSAESLDRYLNSIATTDWRPMALAQGPKTPPARKRRSSAQRKKPALA